MAPRQVDSSGLEEGQTIVKMQSDGSPNRGSWKRVSSLLVLLAVAGTVALTLGVVAHVASAEEITGNSRVKRAGGSGAMTDAAIAQYRKDSKAYGLLKHSAGGKDYCVHPQGGHEQPDDNTKLVLFDCDIPNAARIEFALMKDGRLVHLKSGLCVHTKDVTPYNGKRLVVYGDCSTTREDLRWKMTSKGSIQRVNTNYCVHPEDGYGHTRGGEVVLWDICDVDRIKFEFIAVPTPGPSTPKITFSPAQYQAHGLLKYNGGAGNLCVHQEGGQVIPTDNTKLVLWDCDTVNPARIEFALLKDGRLVHVSSGKCVHVQDVTPVNGKNIVVYAECRTSRADIRWTMTSKGSVQRVNTNYCWHPQGGTAARGDGLVLWNVCDEDRLKFSFIPLPTTQTTTPMTTTP